MRTRFWVLLACVPLAAACDVGYTTGISGGGTSATGSVTVSSNNFGPTAVGLGSGGSVVWTWNSGGGTHNVTFEASIAGSGDKTSGTFSQTFSSPGTYRFRCTHHSSSFTSGMVGIVVVGSDDGDPPDPPDPPDPYPY